LLDDEDTLQRGRPILKRNSAILVLVSFVAQRGLGLAKLLKRVLMVLSKSGISLLDALANLGPLE
jgi:hypothetical protein